MLTVLTEIAEKARWTASTFKGKLQLSGRVLSPVEAQAAGIASKTLISKMMTSVGEEDETPLEERIERLKPEDILSFGASDRD